MSCPFCDYVASKDGLIAERERTIVILSNPRLVPGHILVMPKRHALRISELDEEERRDRFDMLAEFEKKVISFASGCDIRQNYRPFIPQGRVKVDHVHFHLLPREDKDELYQKSMIFEADLFRELPEEERMQYEKMFK
jgi:histidine triad (HIT) family protein